MSGHSTAYIEFEKNVLNLKRLSYGMRYLVDNKIFNQELDNTIDMEIEVSNILLRTYIERFVYNKSGNLKTFFEPYKTEIEGSKIQYQRDFSKVSVLDINRYLRHNSVHSEQNYEFIESHKKPIQILSEPVIRLTNNLGEKEIVLLHDLDKKKQEELLVETQKKMTITNDDNDIEYYSMVYGQLLISEVLECIRKIDLK